MTSQDRAHVLPLEPFSLSAVPLTTHNLAWSPDAELAIASDDCVYLFLPEFPSAGTTAAGTFGTDYETQRQYHEISFRFPVVELRQPELNRPLFAASHQPAPNFSATFGNGLSVVANLGSSLNHAVAVEWSPLGLGRMQRAVLAVLTGTGALTIFCEGVSNDAAAGKIKGRNIRTLSSWLVPWAVGDNLVVPRAAGHEAPYSKERLTSFAWARDTEDPGALLAYVNDEDEVVILSVQSRWDSRGEAGSSGQWLVEEVGRFLAPGPHPKGNPADPDYYPSGTSFGLQWSPWLRRGASKTSFLSYVTKNYVGFREITVKGHRKPMETPKVEIPEFDSNGVCLHLAPDAFLKWEDLIWTIDGSKVCRGIVATPAKVQPFQVIFNSTLPTETATPHSTDFCNTTYPPYDESDEASNPITGLTIHDPDLSKPTPSPRFTLVRLSATSTNDNWYQTNLPVPLTPDGLKPRPRWADEISRIVDETQPLALAYRPLNPDGTAPEAGEEGGDDEGGDGAPEEEADEEDDDDDNSESAWDSDTDLVRGEFQDEMERLEDMERVNPTRVRIWGMAASAGGGTTAIFATLNSALKPERHTFAGMRCRVLFAPPLVPPDPAVLARKRLSTEARVWEWMYGGGPPVPGARNFGGGSSDNNDSSNGDHAETMPARARNAHVQETLRGIATSQKCVFCQRAVRRQGAVARCEKGHTFERCAATGVPILAPGITYTCGVCGSKCLRPGDLAALAAEHDTGLAAFVEREVSSELCGGCGGKFMS